jgi:hypothetical protein
MVCSYRPELHESSTAQICMPERNVEDISKKAPVPLVHVVARIMLDLQDLNLQYWHVSTGFRNGMLHEATWVMAGVPDSS